MVTVETASPVSMLPVIFGMARENTYLNCSYLQKKKKQFVEEKFCVHF